VVPNTLVLRDELVQATKVGIGAGTSKHKDSGAKVGEVCFLYGCIYAPHSVLNISGTADLYGALAVRWVNISGTAGIHEVYVYDTRMGDTPWPAGVPLDYRVVSYD